MCRARAEHGWDHVRTGACFSKVPNAFRARKAIRKTPTRLFGKAGLFIYCKGNKKFKYQQSSVPRDAFVLKMQRKLVHPKCARKVSGLSKNGSLIGQISLSPNVTCRFYRTERVPYHHPYTAESLWPGSVLCSTRIDGLHLRTSRS